MHLVVTDDSFVSDIVEGDKAAWVELLQDRDIYENTLRIPSPYTPAAADWFYDHVVAETARQGRSVSWALRAGAGALIGGIGFHDIEVGKSHFAEIGYWLGKPYWGRGIMSAAVRAVAAYGFRELGLSRIAGNVFHWNVRSARVLEKAGFSLEGRLRKHYRKDGKVFDGLLYAKTDEDP